MVEWSGIIALVAQALCAAAVVDQLRRNVFPALHQLNAPSLITDVWAPLAIVMPMVFFLYRATSGSVAGIAWMGVGAPVAVATAGLGGALIVKRWEHAAFNSTSIAMWTGSGLTLLLLGAAHDLTMWMGQFALALAAVLLWVNTPDESDDLTNPGAMQLRAGWGLMLAVLAAGAQGAASMFVPAEWTMISGGIVVASSVMSLAAAARLAGAEAATRISGWAMSYGILLALGVLSLLRLVPAAYAAAHNEFVTPVRRVAFGFGTYWLEGTIAMSFALAAVGLMRAPTAVRRIIGFGLIVAAAVLAAWRLASI